MKKILILFMMIPTLLLADAVIFSGNDVKTLKPNIDLFGVAKILTTQSDPSVAGLAAPIGSIALNSITGVLYLKSSAPNTGWTRNQTGPVNLASEVTGILPTGNGGTGSSNLGTGVVKASAGVLSSSALDLASEVSGVLGIANGGTGSATKDFVDLSTSQTVGGTKTFSNTINGNISGNAATVTTNANLTGEVTSVGNATTVTTPAVINKPLTGLSSTAGTVTATDTIVQAIGKLNGNDGLRQPLSAITAKGDMYVGSSSANTQRLGIGENGSVLSTDLDAANFLSYRNIKENESASVNFSGYTDVTSWSKGRNASVMGGGSFVGTLIRDNTSTKISPSGSYKYTQSGGSQDDYFCTTPTTVYKGGKGDTFFTARYTYDGATGDIQPYLWDATNSVTLNLVPVKAMGATNTAQAMVYAVNIPDATNSVQMCFQVKALNSGKILQASALQVTKSLSELGIVANYNIQSERVANNAATVSGTAGNIRFNTTRITSGSGNIVTSDNGTNTVFTALRSTQINFCAKATIGTSGSLNIYLNGSSIESVTTTATGGSDYQQICSNLIMNGGDYLTVVNTASLRLALADYNFTAIAVENPQVASSNQITSSDNMAFIFKATAIVAGDAIGTFNTYTYASNSNVATIAATAPTQTTLSMNIDGPRVFARAYNTSSTAASPARIDIKIGTGLDGRTVEAFASALKTTPLYTQINQPISGNTQGTYVTYNPSSGILTIDAGINPQGNETIRTVGRDIAGNTSPTSGYFPFTASTQPNVSVIPNASLCGGSECVDVNSAAVTNSGAITLQNNPRYPFLASCTSSSVFACTFTSNYYTSPPICTITVINAGGNGGGTLNADTTTSGFSVRTQNTSTGGLVNQAFTVFCQKTGKDSYPAQYKVAGLNDVSASYWLSANFSASTTIPINFDSKDWDNCTPSCVTVSPTAWRFTAPRSGVYNTSGFFQVNGAYLKLYKNGTAYRGLAYATSVNPSGGFSNSVKLLANEYIDFRPDTSATFVGGNLNGNGVANISITRIGEY